MGWERRAPGIGNGESRGRRGGHREWESGCRGWGESSGMEKRGKAGWEKGGAGIGNGERWDGRKGGLG